jgi:hypothetical protein
MASRPKNPAGCAANEGAFAGCGKHGLAMRNGFAGTTGGTVGCATENAFTDGRSDSSRLSNTGPDTQGLGAETGNLSQGSTKHSFRDEARSLADV